MGERLVHHETPMEYFKDLVESAIERQGVLSSEEATFYLVNLLAGFVSPEPPGGRSLLDEPLAVRLARALQTGGVQQREGLRRVGDLAEIDADFTLETSWSPNGRDMTRRDRRESSVSDV